MLISLLQLTHYNVVAENGEIGKVDDFLFDDRNWSTRYLILDGGDWLKDRKITIPSQALGDPDWTGKLLPVLLKKETIAECPPLGKRKPVSMQHEMALYEFLGYEPYWVKGGLLESTITEDDSGQDKPESYKETVKESQEQSGANPHLRSAREVSGYKVNAADGDIGHIHDFIVDDESWTIRYAVVDTGKWLPGRRVLVSAEWIDKINWDDSEVDVSLSQEAVKNSPKFDPNEPVNREYEEVLFDYYGQPKYWI